MMERIQAERIILGIDPGTTVMGYGVLRVVGGLADFRELFLFVFREECPETARKAVTTLESRKAFAAVLVVVVFRAKLGKRLRRENVARNARQNVIGARRCTCFACRYAVPEREGQAPARALSSPRNRDPVSKAGTLAGNVPGWRGLGFGAGRFECQAAIRQKLFGLLIILIFFCGAHFSLSFSFCVAFVD